MPMQIGDKEHGYSFYFELKDLLNGKSNKRADDKDRSDDIYN